MARFVVSAMTFVTSLVTPAVARAEDADGVRVVTIDAANEAGVSLVDLLGAMSATGLPARAYLLMTGELAPPLSPSQAGVALGPPTGAASVSLERLIDCLAWAESRNTPSARNPRSGASGLLQFMPGTFASTPQGKAGLSIWDPVAQRAAARWMIGQGRLREWTTWRQCA